MYPNILKFFLDVLSQDPVTLSTIKNANEAITIHNSGVIFDLQSLYLLLLSEELIPKSASFKAFKNSLYKGGLMNQDLKLSNGIVEVYQSSKNIDSTVYKLKRIGDE